MIEIHCDVCDYVQKYDCRTNAYEYDFHFVEYHERHKPDRRFPYDRLRDPVSNVVLCHKCYDEIHRAAIARLVEMKEAQ